MDFQRARNAEQKDIRIHEITNATRELLKTNHFSTLSLKKISENCSFSRINLYNYFKTKEAIYLTIYLEDFSLFYQDMFTILNQYTILNSETFASLWSETAIKHENALVWYPLTSSVFEPQVSEDVLKSFKLELSQLISQFEVLVCKSFPKLSDKDCALILSFCLNFGASLHLTYENYPHTVQVIDHADLISVSPGFLHEYRENIIIFIRGLTSNPN